MRLTKIYVHLSQSTESNLFNSILPANPDALFCLDNLHLPTSLCMPHPAGTTLSLKDTPIKDAPLNDPLCDWTPLTHLGGDCMTQTLHP